MSEAPAASAGAGRRVLALIGSCHPAPCATITAVVTALAVASGRGAAGSVLVALTILSGQVSVGWCNDRVDMARDIAHNRKDKPLASGVLRPGAVTAAAVCALVLCVPLSLANGLLAGTVHLVGIAAAWAYNLGLKGTRFSPLPYAIGFGILPAFVTLALPGHPWPPAWATAAGALLGVGAHAANVLPDIDDDLESGIRGLPQRTGQRWARVMAAVSLLTASVLLVLGPPGRIGVAGWVGLGVTGALALVVALPLQADPRSRIPFLATLGLAVLDVSLLLLRGGKLGP